MNAKLALKLTCTGFLILGGLFILSGNKALAYGTDPAYTTGSVSFDSDGNLTCPSGDILSTPFGTITCTGSAITPFDQDWGNYANGFTLNEFWTTPTSYFGGQSVKDYFGMTNGNCYSTADFLKDYYISDSYGNIYDICFDASTGFASLNSSTTFSTPTSTTSTPPVYTGTCTTGDVLCSTLSYLFIPSTDQQATLQGSFGGRWNDISTRAPFGYFAIAITALGGISSTTPSSTDIIPVSDIQNIGFFSYLKTGLGYIFILVFIMFLYYFGRSIEL